MVTTPHDLLDLVRAYLAVHGEPATTGLLRLAYEYHGAACESAAIRRQDAFNASPDNSPDVSSGAQEIARLRLEGSNSEMRAFQLQQPVGLSHLLPRLEDLARNWRTAIREGLGDNVLLHGARSVQ